MAVGPVVVEFVWCDALLAIVKNLDVKHPFHVHGTSSLIGHTATLFGDGGIAWTV